MAIIGASKGDSRRYTCCGDSPPHHIQQRISQNVNPCSASGVNCPASIHNVDYLTIGRGNSNPCASAINRTAIGNINTGGSSTSITGNHPCCGGNYAFISNINAGRAAVGCRYSDPRSNASCCFVFQNNFAITCVRA
ncbi:Uncharacterised protein [Yersinia rohdei]|nr:Uncharacterised protein [Yersinia rohdei]